MTPSRMNYAVILFVGAHPWVRPQHPEMHGLCQSYFANFRLEPARFSGLTGGFLAGQAFQPLKVNF